MDQPSSSSLAPSPAPAQAAPAPAAAPASGLPSASSIISQSWQYYKTHFKRLLGITLVSWIVIAIASALAGAMGLLGTKVGQPPPPFGLGILVFIIVVLIAGCWQYASLIYALTPEGETKSWQEVYKTSKRWLWPYLIAALISGLLTAIGFVLLVIPGIIILTWFSFGGFIVVNENLKAVPALKASRNYVRNRFWAVLGRWLLFALVLIGASIIFGIIGGILHEPGKTIINLIFNLLATPFTAIYGFRLYQAVRQTHS
jgi:Uncharacterised protein family (UPF0259)